MTLTFYPQVEDGDKGTFEERIELLMDAAERYKAVVLDPATKATVKEGETTEVKRMMPRDLTAAFNWEEISRTLRSIRELPEGSKPEKMKKSDLLKKLAEVYEVLRAAKMSKLEAVRLALMSEANELQSGG